jgi:chromosome segregation ATPase
MDGFFSKPILVLLATLGVSGYYWHSEWRAHRQAQAEISQQAKRLSEIQGENASLKDKISDLERQLAKDQDHLNDYSKQVANESKELQSLEAELDAQRRRVDEKQKQYLALKNNTNPDVYTAAKIKMANDAIQDLSNQMKSFNDEINNTQSDAAIARANRKRDADNAIAEAQNQVVQTQASLKDMQTQRNATARDRTLLGGTKQQTLFNMDQQISQTQANLNTFKMGHQQMVNDQKAQTQTLEVQIKQSMEDLRRRQDEVRKKLDGQKAELFKLQEHQTATGNFEKEKNELLSRLAADLKDETAKLATLEAKVRDQKLKAQAASASK